MELIARNGIVLKSVAISQRRARRPRHLPGSVFMATKLDRIAASRPISYDMILHIIDRTCDRIAAEDAR